MTRIPNYFPAHIFLAATYSELGQEAKAQAEAAEVLRISPSFSAEAWAQRLPYKDPAAVERFLNVLAHAGIREMLCYALTVGLVRQLFPDLSPIVRASGVPQAGMFGEGASL